MKHNLDTLRSALSIPHERGTIRFGKRARAILQKMLDEPQSVAMLSSAQLAQVYSVNPSTLTRIAQRLGYSGFTELQIMFREHIVVKAGYYAKRTNKLIEDNSLSESNFANALLEKEFSNTRRILEHNSLETIERAANEISKARKVYILGLRATYSLSHFLSNFLSFIRADVRVLGGAGFSIAEELSRATEEDIMIILTFRPYTNSVVNIFKSVKSLNIKIILITDLDSPFFASSLNETFLYVNSPFMFDSALANLFIVELIVAAVAKQMGDKALDSMYNIESRLKMFDIEASG